MKRGKGAGQYGGTGFTLIELLVVIAVIALVAGIAFPVFAQARGKARQASCLGNIHQLVKAVVMYKDDYDGFYPQLHMSPGPNSAAMYDGYEVRYWHILLYPYVKNWAVYRCPSCAADNHFTGKGKSRLPFEEGAFVGQTCDIYQPPDLPGSNFAELRARMGTLVEPKNESWVGTGGYGWNACASRADFNDPVTGRRASFHEAAFVAPATTLMFGELTKAMHGAALYPPPSDLAYRAKYGIYDGCGWVPEAYAPNSDGNPYAWQMSSRHHDGSNVSFFDGHSKWVKREWLEQNPQIFHQDSTRLP